MSKSGIEWTEYTWNPTVGCTAVSPGCDNCYAARDASGRLSGNPIYAGLAVNGRFTGEVRRLPERLDQPLRWRKPRMIFVNSMSDLFHPTIPLDFLDQVFSVMDDADWHKYQVLTKRPHLMGSFSRQRKIRPHIWLGTSVETERYRFRIDQLRQADAPVRFLSLEPLLGPLPNLDLTGIHQVIVGGESGPAARPLHPEWVRDIRDQCLTAGVPFFFKQWGEYAYPTVEDDQCFSSGRAYNDPRHGGRSAMVIRDKATRPFQSSRTRPMEPGDETVGGTICLDEYTVAVRVGKAKAGRELDGRTWSELPWAAGEPQPGAML